MNSWSDPRDSGSELHPSSPHLLVPPPPTPPRNFSPHFPRRRENVAQPPPLITSLSGVQLQTGMSPSPAYTTTTSSMTSHSSPFSPLRSPHVPYNPQQWGPIRGSSRNMASEHTAPSSVQRPEETGGLSPPPPYSPRQPSRPDVQSEPRPLTMARSAAASPIPSSSQYSNQTPVIQPESFPVNQIHTSRRRPMSMVYGTDQPATQIPHSPPPNGHNHLLQQGYYSSATPSIGGNINTVIPPASRRAASTGDIGPDGSHVRAGVSDTWAHRRAGRWEPGMPLPPPPPGPPPGPPFGASRPSVSRNSSYGPPSHDQPTAFTGGTRRSPPILGTALDMVPPTPEGWVDDTEPSAQSPNAINTEVADSNVYATQQETLNDSILGQLDDLSLNGLNSSQIGSSQLSRPTSDASSKGIRERRIESRHGRGHSSGDFDAAAHHEPPRRTSDDSWPADLVLANPGGPGLTRRRTVTKSTPRSGRSPADDQKNINSSPAGPLTSASPSFSTPRQNAVYTPDHANGYVHTPPFSPGCEPRPTSHPKEKPPHVPPKALPTPPLIATQGSSSVSGSTPGSADKDRPISHLLHIPIDGSARDPPLSPEKSAVEQKAPIKTSGYTAGDFMSSAIQRHREFIEQEATATNPARALEMFAEYVLSECSIRELRYTTGSESNNFDIQTIRDKLFEPVHNRKTETDADKSSPSVEGSARFQIRGCSPDVRPPRAESGWWNNYKPSLSPIASMSMSNDEMSSRGRAPSRWWESQTGSDSGGCGSQGAKRSKQEAKYMGVSRKIPEDMQLENLGSDGAAHDSLFAHGMGDRYSTYGQSEYPPEKVGWNDQEPQIQVPTRNISSSREALKLDISRFVTLPPPYPRHYPAVNNSHPDLTLYRTTVRTLSDLSEVQSTKDDYQDKMKRLEQERQYELVEKRRQFRAEMNNQIEKGTISYAEAAEAEAFRRVEEHKQERELLQVGFDSYQESVFTPLQSILRDRIDIASNCIDDLQSKAFESAQHENPDQTQEEGDAQPELLEKLTQLKWLFEVREQLHRETYTLQSERNEKYQALVTLPYKLSNNQEKAVETDKFFRRDAQDRQIAFATETLRRSETFMDVIEDKVGRGVELQLSAFWDIAPSLVAILHNIPEDLRGFSVKIPPTEYKENPSYYQFPLQYLYSLISHTGKATYQFIESQINLLCLLHEVKSGLMAANCKFMEVQRINSGEPEDYVVREMDESRGEEEKRLTADLKDKVGTVEGQWAEALGGELGSVTKRVRQWLIQEGGWDELEQMEQS